MLNSRGLFSGNFDVTKKDWVGNTTKKEITANSPIILHRFSRYFRIFGGNFLFVPTYLVYFRAEKEEKKERLRDCQ